MTSQIRKEIAEFLSVWQLSIAKCNEKRKKN